MNMHSAKLTGPEAHTSCLHAASQSCTSSEYLRLVLYGIENRLYGESRIQTLAWSRSKLGLASILANRHNFPSFHPIHSLSSLAINMKLEKVKEIKDKTKS